MALIQVNISGVAASVLRVLPKRSDRKAVTRQLGAAAMKYWKDQAKRGLKSSRSEYVENLQHTVHGDVIRITLRGMIPNMIEGGWPGGDMRTWLLKGPNAKMGKDGPYNTVPFRHGTPGSSGANVGAAMPQPLYSPAQRLKGTLSRPGAQAARGPNVIYGQRLHADVFRMSKKAKDILNTLHRPWHTTSIYKGMIRQEKTYKSRTQSQYMTFRRISSVKNDPRSWYHKGITARHYAQATQRYVESIAQSIVHSVVGT